MPQECSAEPSHTLPPCTSAWSSTASSAQCAVFSIYETQHTELQGTARTTFSGISVAQCNARGSLPDASAVPIISNLPTQILEQWTSRDLDSSKTLRPGACVPIFFLATRADMQLHCIPEQCLSSVSCPSSSPGLEACPGNRSPAISSNGLPAYVYSRLPLALPSSTRSRRRSSVAAPLMCSRTSIAAKYLGREVSHVRLIN